MRMSLEGRTQPLSSRSQGLANTVATASAACSTDTLRMSSLWHHPRVATVLPVTLAPIQSWETTAFAKSRPTVPSLLPAADAPQLFLSLTSRLPQRRSTPAHLQCPLVLHRARAAPATNTAGALSSALLRMTRRTFLPCPPLLV